MKIRDKILAIFFFGINALGLPAPLLYSNFISLFYTKNLLKKKYFLATIIYVFGLLMYFAIHHNLGIEINSYLTSFAVYLLVFINVMMAHNYLKYLGDKVYLLFQFAAKLNFFLFIIALFCLVVDIPNSFWRYYSYSEDGGSGIPRLQSFFYEPSYLALLFTPVLLYFFLNVLFNKANKKNTTYFVLSLIPVLATWSFGVIAAVIIAVAIVVCYYSVIYYRINKYILGLLILAPFGLLLLFLFNTEISVRIVNIFSGDDGSAKGRITDSFFIANHLINEKSAIFGIGLGQIKVFGEEYIQNYYGYQKWYRVSIPNAFAETLAIFGYLGAAIRLFLQLFLFYFRKCYKNIFSITLFTFIFIYQFTGSFITSTTEYVIWLLALMNIFPKFNIFYLYEKDYK
ncbi:hypothetical protein [Flavisericum labens]|uniref:hypothetical protein n=1 Tax=Flavisericum labens TaxID=3377112 RepID=UPI00387B058A